MALHLVPPQADKHQGKSEQFSEFENFVFILKKKKNLPSNGYFFQPKFADFSTFLALFFAFFRFVSLMCPNSL
jgi:hypothetical protein